ncbi:MAG: hypothetical protein IJR83_07910 [Clostridia bacterium]|nr:hypothetical protein [Clostridia bacterium]
MERLQFEKFPLGFWYSYPYGIEGMTEKEIADMADCGMTLTMSPWTSHQNKDATLRALDLCQKYGIKLILVDTRTYWTNISKGRDEYYAAMKETYEDYGKHPATFGFFLGDEPNESQLDMCTEAYKIALEACPGLVPYLNQNPGYAEKCKKFVMESGCKLLSYDRYNQMNPEDQGDDFIRDLAAYKALADEANIPLLAIMLSVGHFRYRVPSEDDLRWQAGVALACGADAIFWFTYHTPVRCINYRGGPISEFGEKNPTYYALKNIQRRFNRDYANLFCNRNHLGVYTVGRCYKGLERFIAPSIPAARELGVINAWSALGTPGLVTFFEGNGPYAGKKYIMITNNSYKDSDKFFIDVAPDKTRFWVSYATDEVDFAAAQWDSLFYKCDRFTECGVHLAPGQFEIFRFE